MKKHIPLILAFITSSIFIIIMRFNEFSILSAGILLSLLVIALEGQVIYICLSTYEESGKGLNLFLTIGVMILLSLLIIIMVFVHIVYYI